MIDRLSRVEAQYQSLRENVRNEILADIKAEVAVVKFALGRFGKAGVTPGPGLPSLLSPGGDNPA